MRPQIPRTVKNNHALDMRHAFVFANKEVAPLVVELQTWVFDIFLDTSTNHGAKCLSKHNSTKCVLCAIHAQLL